MSELIEILDKKGSKSGNVLTIDEVHRQELWHGVTHIWVYNKKGQMLLQLRHKNKSWGAGTWDLAAGGHISAHETPEQAAVREIKEELGLDVREDQLFFVSLTTAVNTTETTGRIHRAVEWNYIVEIEIVPVNLKLQAGETQAAGWFNLEKVEKDLENENSFKKYAPRDKALYRKVISEIRNQVETK